MPPLHKIPKCPCSRRGAIVEHHSAGGDLAEMVAMGHSDEAAFLKVGFHTERQQKCGAKALAREVAHHLAVVDADGGPDGEEDGKIVRFYYVEE